MGITVLGSEGEEIKHLIEFAKNNIRDIKRFLVIVLSTEDSEKERLEKEIPSLLSRLSDGLPFEVKFFTGSIDTALETFLAKKEDIRMVFLHVRRDDVTRILTEDRYTAIIRKLQKGVLKVPVVFVPHP